MEIVIEQYLIGKKSAIFSRAMFSHKVIIGLVDSQQGHLLGAVFDPLAAPSAWEQECPPPLPQNTRRTR